MNQIKLPKNPGDTGWKEILPKRKVNPKLSDHLNVDYLIIGGGFAGCASAEMLSKLKGVNISIIEKKPIIGITK